MIPALRNTFVSFGLEPVAEEEGSRRMARVRPRLLGLPGTQYVTSLPVPQFPRCVQE